MLTIFAKRESEASINRQYVFVKSGSLTVFLGFKGTPAVTWKEATSSVMKRQIDIIVDDRSVISRLLSWAIIFTVTLAPQFGRAADVSESDIIAVVGGVRINRATFQERTSDRLLRSRTEEYNAEVSILNDYIDEVLVSQEAERRNITEAELLNREINSQVPVVTEAEARAVVETASSYKGLPPDQAVKAATADIRARRVAKLRAEYLNLLRSRTPIEISLAPPRLHRRIAGGRSIGPPDAPVSIVEFSDFQCPYCASLTGSLMRLRSEYLSKVRLTFKQFPLPVHPQAAKAAEVSLCAGEQDHFWQMHDLLFGQQNAIDGARFTDLAENVGINIATFKECLSSHRFSAEITDDRLEAIRLGLTGTPSLFINGRLLVGSKPYEALRTIVEEELKRASQ